MSDLSQKLWLSASRINDAEECFGKFKYRYIDEIKVTGKLWPITAMGLTIHAIMQVCLDMKQNGLNDRQIYSESKGKFKMMLDATVDEEFKKNNRRFIPTKDYNEKEFLVDGERYSLMMVHNILSRYQRCHKVVSEQKFRHEFTLFPLPVPVVFTGKIDFLFMMSPTIYDIIDFKVTKRDDAFVNVDWLTDLQSRIYLYLLWKEFGVPARSFSYMVLNAKKEILFNNGYFVIQDYNDPRTIDKLYLPLKATIERIHEQVLIHKERVNYQPEATRCMWCDYNTMCPKAIRR